MFLSRMIAIPSMHQVVSWFGWGHDAYAVAAVSGILALVVILVPVVAGLSLFALERLQIKLLSCLSSNFAYFFVNFLTFPGTFIHESSHMIFAVLTGAKVTEVCFFENKEGRLGHVSYRPRGPFPLQMAQNALIAVAPTVVGFVGGYFLLRFILDKPHEWWGYVGLWYLFISIVDHSTMSDVDLKNYFQGVWIFLPPFFGVFFAMGMLN